jgi:hypothetical protein
LYDFTTNPHKAIKEHAKGYYEHYNQYSGPGIQMPSFLALTNNELDAIYGFISNESKKTPWMKDAPDILCDDSCYRYFTLLDSLTRKPASVIVNDWYQQPEDTIGTTIPDEGLRNGFTDGADGGFYRFSIQTFGWYNIDAFASGLPGTSKAKINVDVQGTGKPVNMYLFIPARKMLSVSNEVEGNEYSFHKEGDSISIDMNVPAYIVAFSDEGNDRLLLGITAFTTSKTNRLNVNVRAVTKQEFEQKLKSISLEGISFTAEKKPTNNKIKPGIDSTSVVSTAIDSLYELYTPRYCNCMFDISK